MLLDVCLFVYISRFLGTPVQVLPYEATNMLRSPSAALI